MARTASSRTDRLQAALHGDAHGWADLFGWVIKRDTGTPVFRQLYLHIRLAILSGRLGAETKLPSTRALASELAVARTSVVAAYEQLLAEGYASGKIGSGTYISSELPDATATAVGRSRKPAAAEKPSLSPRAQQFAALAPATAPGANLPFDAGRALVDVRTTQIWSRLSRRMLVSIDPVHLGYSDPRGLIELRTAICDHLRAMRAVRCEPDQVIVTSGAQQATDLAIRVLLDRDDEAWVEDPCYPLTYQALAVSGARIHPVAVDAGGIDVRAGIRAAPKARVAFVTPSHQHPLGVVLSMARRLELLGWARENKAWIVEDDYDSEFRYSGRPLASLQGLDDSDRVIYVGTLQQGPLPGSANGLFGGATRPGRCLYRRAVFDGPASAEPVASRVVGVHATGTLCVAYSSNQAGLSRGAGCSGRPAPEENRPGHHRGVARSGAASDRLSARRRIGHRNRTRRAREPADRSRDQPALSQGAATLGADARLCGFFASRDCAGVSTLARIIERR